MKSLVLLILGLLYFGYYFIIGDKSTLIAYAKDIEYGLLILSYLNGLFGGITMFGLIGLLNKYLARILTKIFAKTINEIDDILVEFIFRFINIVKYLAGAYVFFYLADLPNYIYLGAQKISGISLLIIFLYFLTSFVNIIFSKELILKSKLKAASRSLLPFVNKVVVVFIWIIGAVSILGNLGYDVTALIAGAGIGGLAFAFAAQKSIANVFGAITILLNKPFKIGDYISVNGVTGTVKDIGLSYLTVIDKMGHQVMVPNEAIISTNVENFTERKNRRTEFSVGLIYDTSLEDMKAGVKIIEDILETYVVDETIGSYRVNFEMFGDFSLNINTTYFSLINKSVVDYGKQKQEINLEIKKQFATKKLEMAFPTQELIIKK